MSLIEVSLPLRPLLRILRAVERIANALDRAYPDYTQAGQPPEPGLTIVTNEAISEEQTRENLRSRGYKPDDVDAMIEAAKIDAV